ncbi:MAG: 1-(5-phosphoribosyl)-5-[(5-phosphoribosylamino)methylideneamino]imidazole-4-carboxamide isomerase [Rhodothermales bacterium]|nr:1-(5-phosphoribosyl)-5-[(5-phosphoribosylamino)methylideneamino]imidazole-4-carboxamide isomerase [Rhodothermales bacterium]
MIIPAIDLLDGKVVRLRKGDFGDMIPYTKNPAVLASSYAATGVEWIHLVDLSGARDPALRQVDLVEKLAGATRCQLQVGGGIRTIDDVRKLLDAGVDRVVIGSVAIESPETVVDWMNVLPEGSLLPAIDVKPDGDGDYRPVIKGWTERGKTPIGDILQQMSDAGLREILMTDVSRDGMLEGPNAKLYNRFHASFPELQFQASGGVSSLDDIRQLRTSAAVSGVIVGRALLDGIIILEEAVACWQNG